MKKVVIIGGGFSGTAVAIHLVQLSAAPLDITVLEPRAAIGGGVAYSSSDPVHRINVPATRMQLAGEEEGAFERWYRQQPDFCSDPQAQWGEAIYPQRGAFGRYLAQRFHQAARHPRHRLRQVTERAVACEEKCVITEQGKAFAADLIVLAVSHPPPAVPERLKGKIPTGKLLENPWQTAALADIAVHERIAIMGTGLTMADVVASLKQRGHQGPILAFSRHGMLSRTDAQGTKPEWQQCFDVTLSLKQQLAAIRLAVRQATAQQLPWQSVLDAVRSQAQGLWQHWSLADKHRFLRHLRTCWDVHRYRVAPQVYAQVDQLRQQGTLKVLAARLHDIEYRDNVLHLHLQQRNGQRDHALADRLILTTGPAHQALIQQQPLLKQWADAGQLQSDPLGLGIHVNTRSEVLDAQMRPNPFLLVAGPAARGTFGELMGLPQVADHALKVARQTLATLDIPCVTERCCP
ncbi:FAD-dependent oxidoreductase [Enterobacterales bacterium CwR94]|nr:FAD-dependent oxidoreductase [Enterobacterales bacterium CwR94]